MSPARLACALSLALLAFGPACASAQTLTPDQTNALRIACEIDINKLCAGLQPGDERLLQCLKEHREEVTPPCQASLGALAASMRKR